MAEGNIPALVRSRPGSGHRFSFFVISAAPGSFSRRSRGIVAPERFGPSWSSPGHGESTFDCRVPAGYGKVAVVELERGWGTAPDGPFTSATAARMCVMLHVNNRAGFTIAVSENTQLSRIAQRTVLSDDAFSVTVPILEQVCGCGFG